MSKFNISETTQVAYLTSDSESNIYITDTCPINAKIFIKAPRIVCNILLNNLLSALAMADFDVRNEKYIIGPKDSNSVHELLEHYTSQFGCYSQYLVILDEDCYGYPRGRFEFNTNLKKKLFDDYSRQGKNLDLLQVASGIAVDALSIRQFHGHVEVVNRFGSNPLI